MDSCSSANELLGTDEEMGDSSTEASSVQDVCFIPRTAATDSTRYDNYTGADLDDNYVPPIYVAALLGIDNVQNLEDMDLHLFSLH